MRYESATRRPPRRARPPADLPDRAARAVRELFKRQGGTATGAQIRAALRRAGTNPDNLSIPWVIHECRRFGRRRGLRAELARLRAETKALPAKKPRRPRASSSGVHASLPGGALPFGTSDGPAAWS